MMTKSNIRCFPLGQLVATPAALDAFKRTGEEVWEYVIRHSKGDWGDICTEDKRENQFALKNGLRLMSAYHLTDGTKIWIITEADRSVTTVLLPSDY
jgi:hypothetical protein